MLRQGLVVPATNNDRGTREQKKREAEQPTGPRSSALPLF